VIRTETNDGIGTIIIDNPPINALDIDHSLALRDALRELTGDSETLLILIRATGRAFCGGADIKHLADVHKRGTGETVVDVATTMQQVYAEFELSPAPTIAVLHGATVGAGLELALACDFRIASNVAKIGLPEAHLGLLPAAGGTQRLTRAVGRSVALRMIVLGELISGAQAQEFNLVQWAVAPEELEMKVAEVVATLRTIPRQVIQAARECISAAPNGFDVELEWMERLQQSDDVWERLDKFIDGRKK
jgi:enoyl-CoA hydratase/carnithine racemase